MPMQLRSALIIFLKQEFNLEEFNVKLPIMQSVIKDSIKIYNTKRPHLSCYMHTPEQMHKQNSIKIKTYKKTKPIEG